jgi:septal ring factor EnvC (AmiA/AmiB activator)
MSLHFNHTSRGRENHSMRIAQLRREIAEEQKILSSLGQQFTREKSRQIARNEYEYATKRKQFTETINEAEECLSAIIAFYDERLSVLAGNMDTLKRRRQNRPSRQCDFERIERLTFELRGIKIQLATAINELNRYQETSRPRYEQKTSIGISRSQP